MAGGGEEVSRHRQRRRSCSPPGEPRSALLEQRKRETPPLPLVLQDLRSARFKEVQTDARPQPSPHLSSLKPLTLRKVLPGAEPLPLAQTQAAAPSAAAAPSGGGSAVSSAACSASASSSSYAPAPAPSSVSTDAWATCNDATGSLRVGVVYCGEFNSAPVYPVNVLPGLLEYLTTVAPGSQIVGFQDGPTGVLNGCCRELTAEEIRGSINQGALQLLRYGTCSEGSFAPAARADEAQRAAAICSSERLDSLVVMAGPKDLSWASAMATCFAEAACRTTVIGVPFSKNLSLYVPKFMPITLGFDSARRMLSEVAGNIVMDALSSRKYWHFVRCGGDALTVEVALQTRCTMSVLTREQHTDGQAEAEEERPSLMDVVDRMRKVISHRRQLGRSSGVVLVSGKVIETLPEMEGLKKELLTVLGDAVSTSKPPSVREVETQLKREGSKELFKRLPRVVQMSLILRRDSSGLPLLPADLQGERLLGRFVEQALYGAQVKTSEHSHTARFAPRFHVIDLMSNAPLPSAFDCAFGFLLGHAAGVLACERRTSYVVCCADLHQPVDSWQPCAVPFSFLFPDTTPEKAIAAKCEDSPVDQIPTTGWTVRRNLVEVYRHFREVWTQCNAFKCPGPMQFGNGEVGPLSERPFSLLAEYMSIQELKQLIQPMTALPPPLKVCAEPYVMRDIRVFENLSVLEQQRKCYKPGLPAYLRSPLRAQVEDITPQACTKTEELSQSFPIMREQCSAVQIVPFSEDCEAAPDDDTAGPPPSAKSRRMRIGVVFASNQAPGFHTVVAGLFDYLATQADQSELLGYYGGFEGLIKGNKTTITEAMVEQYRNLGGQDMLCQFDDPSTLSYKDHLKAVVATVAKDQLDGLVLVGNLSSQCDNAFIAEACAAEHLPTRVVGVPVSLDCDFPFVQQTVGFDSLCRTLTGYMGNIGQLARASGRRWLFVRIMGDAWSHIAVQCTLQALPNLVLLSGSMLFGQSLTKLVMTVSDIIVRRHEAGADFGLILVPMGFVLDITEMRLLFSEITEIMANAQYETSWDSIPGIASKLKPQMAALFDVLPRDVQYEICFGGRERRTNKIDLSVISSDRLLLRLVEIELQRRRQLGVFSRDFFHGSCCPLVYQARSALPTDFDCDLAYTLGWGAGALAALGKSGQLVHASGLDLPVDEWRLGGIPLTSLLTAEHDDGMQEQWIRPAKVQLLRQRGIVRPFTQLPRPVDRVAVYHGPVQFYGETAFLPSLRKTWFLMNMPIQDPTEQLREIAQLCSELQSTMAQARNESTLYAVNSLLSNALSVLESYRNLADSSRTSKPLADVPIGQMPIGQMPQVWRTKRTDISPK